MDQRRCFGREDLLGFVELGALKSCQPIDLIEREFGEELEKARDVRILSVPPKLPIGVRRQHVWVEPDGTGRGLAHLGAR